MHALVAAFGGGIAAFCAFSESALAACLKGDRRRRPPAATAREHWQGERWQGTVAPTRHRVVINAPHILLRLALTPFSSFESSSVSFPRLLRVDSHPAITRMTIMASGVSVVSS